VARRFLFDLFGARDVVVGLKLVIVREFFARFNISQGVNEDSPPLFPHYTIRFAGMIDPLRFVSSNRGVDHPFAIANPEKVHPRILLVVGNRRPQNAATSVFDNSFASPKRFPRKNAATMHAGSLYHDAKHAPSAAVFRWLLRSHKIISHVWAKSETLELEHSIFTKIASPAALGPFADSRHQFPIAVPGLPPKRVPVPP
jgi:hypothetical protein